MFSWSEFNFNNPKSKNEIMEQIVWYNSCIRVANKPVFMDKCFKAGFLKIKDILRIDGTLYNYEEFVAKYGAVTNFVSYNGLISAIPSTWKGTLKKNSENDPKFLSNYKHIIHLKKISSFVYNQLIHVPKNIIKAKCKWEEKLSMQVDLDNFIHYFTSIYSITWYTKLRSFQYRLLHYAIITNVDLFKWKIIELPKCTFCNEEDESIIHLLYNCTITSKFWNDLKQFLHNLNPTIQFELQVSKIIFSNYAQDIVNQITLIAKQYIYRSRCFKTKPNICEMLRIIKETQNIEKNIASSNDQLDKFNRKWSLII